MSERDWNDMTTAPEGVFDVFARRYDAGLNRFVIMRFTGCIREQMSIFWGSPFLGDETKVELSTQGYRVVAWKPAPGPEDIPHWLEVYSEGPPDRINVETGKPA